MHPSHEPVRFAVEGSVARITLDNPSRKNAITLEMAASIVEFCDRVEKDSSIGAVLVGAEGPYFCSGADTRDLAASSADPASAEAVRRTSAVYESFVRVGSLPVPTVSMVVGGAVGAGLNLAMATDIMLVTEDAVLDSGFLARHIHPGGGHLSLLGRTLSTSETIAMAGLGIALSGTDAVRRGLAYACVDTDDMDSEAAQLVRHAAADPELTRAIKNSIRLELGPPAVSWASALEIERGVQMWSMGRKGDAGWKNKPAKPTPVN
ncbi:enoyl-CoA hydratase-related protein [Rhodococcus qingshengii]|uniref:enoyl-CoA hydratase-related protein n=1 Tax=Rhodococcus qingshengii TaxID=334542 RepID=UPI002119F3D6|nr:enoyl-CoA hydratase-related protein [Rhodococcus qingshengii]